MISSDLFHQEAATKNKRKRIKITKKKEKKIWFYLIHQHLGDYIAYFPLFFSFFLFLDNNLYLMKTSETT